MSDRIALVDAEGVVRAVGSLGGEYVGDRVRQSIQGACVDVHIAKGGTVQRVPSAVQVGDRVEVQIWTVTHNAPLDDDIYREYIDPPVPGSPDEQEDGQ